jgi:alkylhydroperoxidase/carboxymuconolactone decarboxylase family protein YurZ
VLRQTRAEPRHRERRVGDELVPHLRGALDNDCPQQEIAAAIVRSAIYCGLPAAISYAGEAPRYSARSQSTVACRPAG